MQMERLEDWITPVWKSCRIWEEPVCFFEDGEGEICGGNLLYAPEKIIKITNHDATIEYDQGRDYEVTEYGISRTEGSRIPIMHRNLYVAAYTEEPGTDWLCLPGKKEYVRIFADIYRYQILVTYERVAEAEDEETWQGYLPLRQGTQLQNTYAKLEQGKTVHIAFYGDSITAGWEASGADEWAVDMNSLEPCKVQSDRYPYMPVWAELVTQQLRRTYPQATIVKHNLSAGGSTAQWGEENADTLFDRVEAPDLVFVGFGMNCMWDTPAVFAGKIWNILDKLCRRNPNCEFVLYPAMAANTEMEAYQNDNMEYYERALIGMTKRMGGLAIAHVHSMFKEILSRGKEYYEISGNAVNHPNDFAIRIYAQIMLETIGR